MKANLKFYFAICCIIFYPNKNLVAQKYIAFLSGSNEAPPNSSTGIGLSIITIIGYNMRVQCTFSGLGGVITAAHIHAATAVALTGTAGVATVTPTFTGFPIGVTSGTYDNTFDMSLASSFNPAYVTAHGSIAQAWDHLKTAILDGKSYFNIHSNIFPAGEIRGFLIPSTCSSTKTGDWNDASIWNCSFVPTSVENVKILSGHIVSIPTNYTAYAKNIEINGELRKGDGSNLILNQ